MNTFSISNSGLTTLKDVHFPKNVTELYCEWNQLTSLEYCPAGVTRLYCGNNPLNDEYNGLDLSKIHKVNKKKSFFKGFVIIQKMIQNSMAMRIQKKWRWWWYDTIDDEGISRFCRRAVDELNDNIS